MKKLLKILLILTVFLAGSRGIFAQTGINPRVNFQGKVVNKGVGATDGTNVIDGSYDFKFSLWNVLSAGTSIWSETWNSGTTQVAVNSGIFAVALGTYTSLSPTVDFNNPNIYLSVEYNHDGEMSPRIQMAAVPYAFNAEKVNGLTVTNTTGVLSIGASKTITFGDNFTTITGVGITLDQSLATTDSPTFAGLSIGGTVSFTNIPVAVGTTVLFIDATGKLSKGYTTSGTGTTYAFINGLNDSGTNTIGLGGTLTANTQIGVSSFSLSFIGLGGTRSLFLSSSGYAGIGTTNPQEYLDVYGNLRIGTSGTGSDSGTIRSTKELVLREDGDTYGASILRLRNRTAENGAIFETTDPTAQLVDFIFKTSAAQRNIRFESRSQARTGLNSFEIGGVNPDNPTLSVGDIYTAVANKLMIGLYTSASQVLYVSGDAKITTNLTVGGALTLTGISSGVGSTVLYINSAGNLVQGTLPTGGSIYTATNGINLDGSSFGLGGILSQLTKIDLNSYNFGLFGTGSLGIGTTDPLYKLQVVGDAMVSTKLGVGATGTAAFNVLTDMEVGTNLTIGGSLSMTAIPEGVGTSVLYISSTGVVTKGTLPVTTVANNKTITLSAEYAGASLSADGSGTTSVSMTSDNTLNAGGVGWKNYYELSSAEAALQDYSVIVRLTLPSDFGSWQAGPCPGSTCALEFAYQTGLSTTADNYISYLVNNDADTPASAVCSIGQTASTDWGLSGCTAAVLGGTPHWNTTGETAVIRIKMAAKNTGSALTRAGDIILRYISSF